MVCFMLLMQFRKLERRSAGALNVFVFSWATSQSFGPRRSLVSEDTVARNADTICVNPVSSVVCLHSYSWAFLFGEDSREQAGKHWVERSVKDLEMGNELWLLAICRRINR